MCGRVTVPKESYIWDKKIPFVQSFQDEYSLWRQQQCFLRFGIYQMFCEEKKQPMKPPLVDRELTLCEMLADPIVITLMRRDGVAPQEILNLFVDLTRRRLCLAASSVVKWTPVSSSGVPTKAEAGGTRGLWRMACGA
jgi:hypothetical protein